VKEIIIHCTDSPNGRDDRAEDVHRWHLEKGWSGIGYHYLICIDGEIENGRPEFWQGAHTHKHNKGSVGVCLVGTDDYSFPQWVALDELVMYLEKKYPEARVMGHNEVSRKKCPGFSVQEWMKWRKRLRGG